MGDDTYLFLLAQDHPWMAASHGRRDVFWAPSAGTLMSRLTGVPEAGTPAIIDSRQSAHAGIPTVPEERAVPVVAYSLALSQRPSRAVLVLVFFRFASAAQVVLVLIFFQEPIRSWKLIADVTYLLFSHMLLLQLTFILRPFARNGLSPLLVMAAHRSHHVDLEC